MVLVFILLSMLLIFFLIEDASTPHCPVCGSRGKFSHKSKYTATMEDVDLYYCSHCKNYFPYKKKRL